MNGMGRGLFVAGGLVFLGVGAAGLLLPLLPGTPFLLLSAACFARGSEACHRRLLAHPWLGPSLRAFEEHRALPRRSKAAALLVLWPSLAATCLWAAPSDAVRLAVLATGAGVSAYILWGLKTLPPEVTP